MKKTIKAITICLCLFLSSCTAKSEKIEKAQEKCLNNGGLNHISVLGGANISSISFVCGNGLRGDID